MTKRLETAFLEAGKLSISEQDAFADFLLAELGDETYWKAQFGRSPDLLGKLVGEARAELDAGATRPFEELGS